MLVLLVFLGLDFEILFFFFEFDLYVFIDYLIT